MKPRQRQAAILEHLQKQGKCSVEDLAHYFDTTGTTIRKDLVLLENSGAVIRTYGGVVLNKDEADPPIDHKTLINTHQKALIAEAAVKFIHDGDSIILDAGSTVLQMIPLLSRFNNITVMLLKRLSSGIICRTVLPASRIMESPSWINFTAASAISAFWWVLISVL